jgi:hypothetical protein
MATEPGALSLARLAWRWITENSPEWKEYLEQLRVGKVFW